MSRVWQSVFPLVLDNIFFDKSTDSKPKFFDAVSAVRPGDSQGGGFSAAPLEPASDQFSRRDKKIAPPEEPEPKVSGEALMKSARADSERLCSQARF